MAGNLIICFITVFALIQVYEQIDVQIFIRYFKFSFFKQIQPFNTLPAADNKQDVIYRNSKGEYYTSDGVVLSDQYPVYWRHKNSNDAKNEHVVIVEPTITYTRQAEYTTTQAAPSTTFRASQNEKDSSFKPYDGSGRTESSAVAYYPYYVRASSSDRNDIEERRRLEERRRIEDSKRVDASDPAYQRFVPRDGSGQGQTWYYYSENPQTSSSAPPPPQATTSSKSAVQFYYCKQFLNLYYDA